MAKKCLQCRQVMKNPYKVFCKPECRQKYNEELKKAVSAN